MPKFIHVDFEKAIINAIKKLYLNIKIRYFLWHFKRNLEIHKNQICNIIDIFNKINNENDNNNFKEFIEYLKKDIYNIKDWNYYKNIEHIINNECEPYNSYINDFFNKKPTFYK